jgi:phage repressor protein C with HTH and peptisase S24 domain
MEQKETTRGQRIVTAFSYLKQTGSVKTQQEVADIMGANKTTVSQALNGNEKYLTDKFMSRFNEAAGGIFNIAWLLTGKGDMLEDVQGTIHGVMVPVVPLSAVGGTLRDIDQGNVVLSDCEVMRAPVNNAEYAIGVYGDSMAPTYPSGCRVFIRRIDPTSFISWGNVFVLDTINGIYIKEVQRGHDDGYILCISHNPSGRYPAFEIPLKDVFGMYRVLASISVTQ